MLDCRQRLASSADLSTSSNAIIPPPAAFASPACQAPTVQRTLSTAERLDRQRTAPTPAPTPDTIVSRRGTVVGRKGTIQGLRARFANPSPSSRQEQTSPAQMVDNGDSFSSRRGSVLLQKGVVSRFKNAFHKKAHNLTTPQPLAAVLAEVGLAQCWGLRNVRYCLVNVRN